MRRPQRSLRTVLVAAGLLVGVAPAGAQVDDGPELEAGRTAAARGDLEEAYARFLEAWDPAADDPAVLSAMAGTASRMGRLADLRGRLAPVVSADPAAKNAARFWAAAALQTDVPVDSVRATLARRVAARPADVEALAGYVRVWIGHGGFDLAEELLDEAAAAGAPATPVAVLRGEFREAAGDPVGALTAYAGGVSGSGHEAGDALRRAQVLLDDWPEERVSSEAVEAVERVLESTRGPAVPAVAALVVRAGIGAGAWETAIAAATHPALGPGERATSLRAVALAARDEGAVDPAREAVEALLALGPPFARPGDRLLLADLAGRRGAVAVAAPERGVAADPDPSDPDLSDPVSRVEAALQRGDREALAEAIEAASERGVDPSALAVPRGDLWLARGRPDSAMAAWLRGVEAGTSRPAGLAALGRARLLQALTREGAGGPDLVAVGEALLAAPAEPAAAGERLRDLAGRAAAGDSVGVAAAILEGLAAEWEGRAGDPSGASRSLERAARATPGEAPALLLAAGRWAARAEEDERARTLWREVALEHPATPYALEARRLLARGEEGR